MLHMRPLPLIAGGVLWLIALLGLGLLGARWYAAPQQATLSSSLEQHPASHSGSAGVEQVKEGLQDYGPAPAWLLVDQNERPIASDSFKGKVVVANFIYTHCPDICSTLSVEMQRLQTRLRDEGLLGTQVQLLSFTTDPARDTSAVLRSYAQGFKADPDAWRFLSGPEQTLIPLIVDDFKLGVQVLPPKNEDHSAHGQGHDSTGEQAYEVMHSGRFVLIDPQGRMRAYYEGETLALDAVVRDIRQLQP